MGKKGRRGNDDWEKDFELDEDGELKALKEPAEEEAAAAGVPCMRQAAFKSSVLYTNAGSYSQLSHQRPSHTCMTACCQPLSSSYLVTPRAGTRHF
jgi:hypothetical protein